jgi:hypothetical protein
LLASSSRKRRPEKKKELICPLDRPFFSSSSSSSSFLPFLFLCRELKIALQISRQDADGNLMPSLSWNFVPIRTDDKRFVVDPVLAFSWGRCVRFMQVGRKGGKEREKDEGGKNKKGKNNRARERSSLF